MKVVTFAHAWTLDAAHAAQVVSVHWRPATNDFQLVVGGETQILTYGDILPFDRELPKNFFFPIGVQNTVANCSAERLEAYVDAQFDDVRINATAISAVGP